MTVAERNALPLPARNWRNREHPKAISALRKAAHAFADKRANGQGGGSLRLTPLFRTHHVVLALTWAVNCRADAAAAGAVFKMAVSRMQRVRP